MQMKFVWWGAILVRTDLKVDKASAAMFKIIFFSNWFCYHNMVLKGSHCICAYDLIVQNADEIPIKQQSINFLDEKEICICSAKHGINKLAYKWSFINPQFLLVDSVFDEKKTKTNSSDCEMSSGFFKMSEIMKDRTWIIKSNSKCHVMWRHSNNIVSSMRDLYEFI